MVKSFFWEQNGKLCKKRKEGEKIVNNRKRSRMNGTRKRMCDRI